MTGPLTGIRVLDATHYAVGPWACALLGEMGAEIIKLEPPEGDYLSRQPPPWKNGITAVYISMNLNKRLTTVDLRDEMTREAVHQLVLKSDVIIENHRPGFMERRGLGYEQVSKINPGIVYCSSSGYGSRGPYKQMGSTDPYGQAISGFASVSGPVGEPPEGIKHGGHIDLTTSQYIVSGVLAALWRRKFTGKGQFIDQSQMQAAVDVRQDVMNGVIKSFVFGVAITWIAVFEGYDAPPTAEGVSGATTRTVVSSSLAVLVLDFIMTALMFRGI